MGGQIPSTPLLLPLKSTPHYFLQRIRAYFDPINGALFPLHQKPSPSGLRWERVAGKYFSNDWPTEASKLKFEKEMFAKARESSNVARSKTDIAMIGEFIVVYRFARDLRMFVTGGGDENEVILATVLEGFADAVGIVLRNNVEKRAVLESMDRIVLCMDEMIDGGIILETRGSVVAAGKTVTEEGKDGMPSLNFLEPQSVSEALAAAKRLAFNC